MKIIALALSLGVLLAGPALVGGQTVPADEQAIRRVLEVDLARLYSGTDAAAIAALWADPATHGGMVEGRRPRTTHAEIEQLWSTGFAARTKDFARRLSLSVSSVQPLSAGLASVDAVMRYTGGARADGSNNPDSKELLFAVMIKTQAGWKILASRVAPQ